MGTFIDLTGQRFGRLVVLERAENIIYSDGHTRVQWLCQCDCGNQVIVRASHLTYGNIKSCGCLRTEILSQGGQIKHNECNTPLYHKWTAMRHRCNNPNNDEYDRYGGRGIQVCPEWDEYVNFRDWALEHGYDEKLTIDRIDNDGNYEPDNCRFATRIEQQNNMSRNIYYSMNGETHTLSEWSRITGINLQTLYSRVNRDGMTLEQAITTPIRAHN